MVAHPVVLAAFRVAVCRHAVSVKEGMYESLLLVPVLHHAAPRLQRYLVFQDIEEG